MSSLSPEQQETWSMLVELRKPLGRVNPIDHKSHCHLFMTGNGLEDLRLLGLGYKFDPEDITDSFDELASFFDESFHVSAPMLAQTWDIDQGDVPFPKDESQKAASYFASYNDEEYHISTAEWEQPSHYGDITTMLSVRFEPTMSPSPSMRIIYFGDEVLISCKYHNVGPQELVTMDDEDFGSLTPQDVMMAQKLTSKIPFREFDTTP